MVPVTVASAYAVVVNSGVVPAAVAHNVGVAELARPNALRSKMRGFEEHGWKKTHAVL